MISGRHDTRMSFIDMLLSSIMSLFVLFILSVLMINLPKKDESGIKPKAELMITMEWQDGLDCDVDVWVRGPNETLVWFRSKSVGLVNLERDDTGQLNDYVVTKSGEKIFNRSNIENVVFRGIVPGEYVVNSFLYSVNSEDCARALSTGLPVKFNLFKLNPTLSLIKSEVTVLHNRGDESTAFRFTLTSGGGVSRVWKEPAKIVDIPMLVSPTINVEPTP